MTTVRLFVGVDLPEDITKPLVRAARLIRRVPEWSGEKWVAPENLHVTLAFLGDVAEPLIPVLTASFAESVHCSHFTLSLDRVVAVPGSGRCSMIWGTFEDPGRRGASLADSVRDAASELGIRGDARPFMPHVTLCRARRPRPLPVGVLEDANHLLTRPAPTVSDPPVTLYASRLTPRGPQYRAVATWHAVGE